MSGQTNPFQNAVAQFEDFASTAPSASVIESHLSFLPRPPLHAKFRQFILFHKGELLNSFNKKFSWWYPQFEIINRNASVIRLSRMVGKREQRQVNGVVAVIPGTQLHFSRLVTVSFSDFWYQVVQRLIKRSYPEAMPVFFKQNEIIDALMHLENLLGQNRRVRITEATMKRSRKGDGTNKKKFHETDRLWTDMPISEVFEQALERNQWFTSIKFSVQKKIGNTDKYLSISTGRIHKYGQLSYDYLHDEISNPILSILEKYSSERLTLLQGRGIRERNYAPSLPIEIEYGTDIFSDLTEVRRFGKVMLSYPDSTIATFHSNPYYHASVADFADGSSFELWILAPSRILISPQAKSSQQAFERLISHIFYEFREGEISEYRA